MPLAKGVFNRRHPYLLMICSFPLAILLDIVKTIAGFRAIIDKFLSQKGGLVFSYCSENHSRIFLFGLVIIICLPVVENAWNLFIPIAFVMLS